MRHLRRVGCTASPSPRYPCQKRLGLDNHVRAVVEWGRWNAFATSSSCGAGDSLYTMLICCEGHPATCSLPRVARTSSYVPYRRVVRAVIPSVASPLDGARRTPAWFLPSFCVRCVACHTRRRRRRRRRGSRDVARLSPCGTINGAEPPTVVPHRRARPCPRPARVVPSVTDGVVL